MRRNIFIIVSITSLIIFGFVTRRPSGATTPIDNSLQDSLLHFFTVPNQLQTIIEPIDSLISHDFESAGLVGGALVITYKGHIAYTKCFGVKKAGSIDPIDKHTVFRLASVSKSVTGVLASIIDDETIVDLDDKVVDYLHDFQLMNPTYTKQLSIRNVLSQSSGVEPHAYDLMVEDKVPLNKIVSYLNQAKMTAAPGKVYTYQNVVYSLYEPILELKMNKDFSNIMQEKVFNPFGMHDASLNYESFANNTNIAYPHVRVSSSRYTSVALNDRYYNTAPAAGVNASISDMGNLLSRLSGHYPHIISTDASHTIFTPHINTPVRNKYFKSWGSGVSDISYGIGWRLLDYKGHRIAYHGGYVKGYKAEIALCNDEDIGIAFLSNSPSRETSKYIPTFLSMYFDINTNEVLK